MQIFREIHLSAVQDKDLQRIFVRWIVGCLFKKFVVSSDV